MQTHVGYYSLIQFCPDAGRLEAVNVGVLLFVPELGYFEAKFSHNHRRAKAISLGDYDAKLMQLFRTGVAHKIDAARSSISDLKGLGAFIDRQANNFQMTEPRWTSVTSPAEDLKRLFRDLVELPAPGMKPVRLEARLRQRFETESLFDRIRENVEVRVEAFGKAVTVPFGFRNGRYNLIRTVRFDMQDNRGLSTACVCSVEGKSMYDIPDPNVGEMKLVVVGSFASTSADQKQTIRKMLAEHEVELFGDDEIDRMIRKIRETASLLGRTASAN